MKKKFRLEKSNAIFLGVCSGLGKYLGIDATIVRLGAVVVTLLGGFPWTFIAYGVAAWLAKPEGWRSGSKAAVRAGSEPDESDRRRIEVETYVASPNSNLAREIDSLR